MTAATHLIPFQSGTATSLPKHYKGRLLVEEKLAQDVGLGAYGQSATLVTIAPTGNGPVCQLGFTDGGTGDLLRRFGQNSHWSVWQKLQIGADFDPGSPVPDTGVFQIGSGERQLTVRSDGYISLDGHRWHQLHHDGLADSKSFAREHHPATFKRLTVGGTVHRYDTELRVYSITHDGHVTTQNAEGDWTMPAGLELGRGLSVGGEIVSRSRNVLRLTAGNQGVLVRSASDFLYLLVTNPDEHAGTWNNLRPLTVNTRTGNVSFGHGATVKGRLSVDGGATIGGALAAGRIELGTPCPYNDSISVANWFRSTGETGWYNTTHAVGIYAPRSGVVATYNNAEFHAPRVVAQDISIAQHQSLKATIDQLQSRLAAIEHALAEFGIELPV